MRLTDKLWAAAVAKLVPIGLMGAFVPGLETTRSGRHGDGDLHVGIDRRSQGGGPVASQRPLATSIRSRSRFT